MSRRVAAWRAAAVVALLACAAPAQERERPRPDTITGRVIAEGAEAGEDAEVMVYPGEWGSGQAQQATVAPDGTFETGPLAPGAYWLAVNLAGYVREGGNWDRLLRPGDSATVRMVRGGVITGAVTTPDGEPVVRVPVRATRVRDEDGKSARDDDQEGSWYTDDRGVYRIYGLRAGVYVVGAGGGAGWYWDESSLYKSDRTVYHPSSGRAQAAELRVAAGQELTNVDIRYRSEPGRVVSGTVVGDAEGGLQVSLVRVGGGTEANAFVGAPGAPFAFRGLADGEYEVRARAYSRKGNGASAAKRVTVRGADVTGLRLILAPLLEIAGRVEVAAEDPARPEACRLEGDRSAREVVMTAAPPAADERREAVRGIVGEGGAFRVRGAEPGAYRLSADLPGPAWYVDSITRGPARKAGAAAPPGAPAGEVTLADGKPVADLLVRVARGAAGVSGTVTAPAGGPPARDMVVYLVPADAALADSTARYYEAKAGAGGAFELKNLAPGAYRLLVRRGPKEREDSPVWDRARRAALRKEAEAAGQPLELAPCQRVKDFAAPAR